MLILNLLGLLQNQSLEIIPIYIVVLCFPHSNIACVHMCDDVRAQLPDHMTTHRPVPHICFWHKWVTGAVHSCSPD